ncbi:MAG: hypothetical protein MRY78_02105 [Saprospiraceae bacterium]|nr:hypothetical protein [Saprospiraceae bacterium]
MRWLFVLTFLGLFYLPSTLASQSSDPIKLSWDLLSDVTFKSVYMEEHATNYLIPTFGEGPLAFENKEVIISGYFIPLSKDNQRFVLSKSPYASCFFCGAAGPETVVEVEFVGKTPKFRLDQYLNMKGTLVLNKDDINHFNYVLKEATQF